MIIIYVLPSCRQANGTVVFYCGPPLLLYLLRGELRLLEGGVVNSARHQEIIISYMSFEILIPPTLFYAPTSDRTLTTLRTDIIVLGNFNGRYLRRKNDPFNFTSMQRTPVQKPHTSMGEDPDFLGPLLSSTLQSKSTETQEVSARRSDLKKSEGDGQCLPNNPS
jgi:hypothetical protein